MGGRGDSGAKPLKSGLVILGAIACGWLAIELAFKPFLDRARNAINKADPNCDPDDNQLKDDQDAASSSSSDSASGS